MHQALLGEWSIAEATCIVTVCFQVPVYGDWLGVIRHSLTGFGLFFSDSGNPVSPEQGGLFQWF